VWSRGRARESAMTCDIHHFCGELSYPHLNSRAMCARVVQGMRSMHPGQQRMLHISSTSWTRPFAGGGRNLRLRAETLRDAGMLDLCP